MFNSNYALFKKSAINNATYQPDPRSVINADVHLQYFEFIGRVIGKAVFDEQHLECYFTRSFYKHILGMPIDYRDVEALDPEFFRSCIWMMENDVTGVMDLTFTVETNEFGRVVRKELKPNGFNIPVTEENKLEYISLICEHKMTDSIRTQLDAFLKGFYEIVPRELVAIFNERVCTVYDVMTIRSWNC